MIVMRTRRSQSSSNLVSPRFSTELETRHQSVLLHEAIDFLAIGEQDIVVDATLGGAGHAKEITKRLGRGGFFVGFDLDSDAINRAEARLAAVAPHIDLINANFADLYKELTSRGIEQIDKALFDLGWSSDQLESGRGFSFLKDEPLQMTYRKPARLDDTSRSGGDSEKQYTLTAADIVNEWEESSIADIIYGWGEERYSRRIAKAIVEARTRKPIVTSLELAEIIRKAVPHAYARGRIHPATRTFQALRIAVNDELGALQKGIRSAWELLSEGGRIAVITFHSIEDRAVKQLFVEFEKTGGGTRLTKKPLIPSLSEIATNPRARSAKLRVIQKHDQTFDKNKQIQTQRPAGNS
jgi:16S rRNA (cytosine1402-N4)-methyltransferase